MIGIIYQIKLLKKQKLLFVLEAILWIPVLGLIIWFGSMGDNSFDLLYTISRFSFYFLGILSVISFTAFRRGEKKEVAEATRVMTGGTDLQSWCAFLAQLLIHFACFLLFFLLLLVLSCANDGNAYFRGRLGLNYLWNVAAPYFVFLLVSWTCARFFNVRSGIACLILFLFLCSPAVQDMTWRSPMEIPIDKVMQLISFPFSFLYNNSDWSANGQLDLQIEPARGQLFLFWIVLLLGIHAAASLRPAGNPWKRRAAYGAAILLSAVFLVFSYLPASTYHMLDRWDGSVYYAYNHYKDVEYDSSLLESPSYRLDGMDLTVKLNRQMEVELTAALKSDTPQDTFLFTLYHGYRVTEAADESGHPMEWRQEEDRLTFTYPEPVTETTIRLQYEGYSPTYYSYSGGSMLPAYFPWYPMAGEKQVYASGRYVRYNQIEEAFITLHLDTDMGVVTNLPKIEEGLYRGTSTGISLFTGLIESTDDPVITSYLPTEYWKSMRSLEETIAADRQVLEDTQETLVEYLGPEAADWLDKPVLIVSSDLSRTGDGFIAVMGDHIIASRVMTADILRFFIEKYSDAFPFVSNFSFSKSPDKECADLLERLKDTEEECLRILGNPEEYDPVVLERAQNFLPETELALEHFEPAVEKYGAKEFMKKMMQYALSEDTVKTDEAFWAWLGV